MNELEHFLQRAEQLIDRLETLLPTPPGEPDWAHAVALRWRRRGNQSGLEAVAFHSRVRLADLLGIDHQKEQIDRNTRQFLHRLPANNVLLWGPRGTGKSSLIKALLNEYQGQGLRLIEVDKAHLEDLPDFVARLHGRDERFIVFCDDLSFEAADASYKTLKVVLDGSLSSTPDNVLIYATSNRRHLLPESIQDNAATRVVDTELHHGDAVEEKISLSERFGMWLAFHPFNQPTYLEIVYHWLQRLDCRIDDRDVIRHHALQWALLHGSRSGRSAWQFSRDWAGRTRLGTDTNDQQGTPGQHKDE